MSSPACATELVAIASVDAGSTMLSHAASAGIKATVIGVDDSAAAVQQGKFCEKLQQLMEESRAQQVLVLSDVDTALLSREFLEAWVGHVLLVHDSLLPSFPEPRPLLAALQAGVCITGCTVCFAVPPPKDSKVIGAVHGPIIMQESTVVLPGDTVRSLHDRVVEDCECKVLPTAMQLVADGAVVLNREGRYRLERTASYIKDSGDDMACDDMSVTRMRPTSV
jgi:phosphoribosylglycinamide formyltransferase-1